ncbi:MAG: RNA polymerase factor sigma-54 [Psychrilyobacter sp.]|nr:RNA polymerase factor sigma-54 [Psychrilyobacter sp.]
MKLENSLSIGLSQKLLLTQKMKLSLKILQMNSEELNEFVQKEQENNILIKVEKNDIGKGKSYKDSEYDPYEKISEKEISFYDHMYSQIGEQSLTKNIRKICEYIVDNLDSRGYISHRLRHPYNQIDFEKGLKIVRGFDPLGVGGDDLKSCLLLQLNDEEIYEKIIVENYLEDLAYGDKDKLAKNIGVEKKKLVKLIKRIKSLNPIPSNGYYVVERIVNLVPDAYIKIDKKNINIKLNEEIIPKILIEQSMSSIDDKKYERYISKCKKRAEFIISCIEQRQETLKKVLEDVVRRQKEFFYNGELKPLTLLEVSDSLGIHQSTVSRTIKNRYIDIDGRTMTLKSLFAKKFKPKNDNGITNEMTRNQIKNIIYKVVMTEDKESPYSDKTLAKLLLNDNIKISRRTVAKYRDEMSLPSSSKRRRI